MVTQEQKNRFNYQQTKEGKELLQVLDWMKSEYCKQLNIPFSAIKTGKLSPLVNGNTGEIDRFIEE